MVPACPKWNAISVCNSGSRVSVLVELRCLNGSQGAGSIFIVGSMTSKVGAHIVEGKFPPRALRHVFEWPELY